LLQYKVAPSPWIASKRRGRPKKQVEQTVLPTRCQKPQPRFRPLVRLRKGVLCSIMGFPPKLWNRMSTNHPKMPISTGENSTVSVEKVPNSIVTAEKVPLWLFGQKWTFFGESSRVTTENSSLTVKKIRNEHLWLHRTNTRDIRSTILLLRLSSTLRRNTISFHCY